MLLAAPFAGRPDAVELRSTFAPVDLTSLSAEDALRLRMSVLEFRSAGRRLIGELYVMTEQLCVMSDILGDSFRDFARNELGLANRMISRYMHINMVLKTHFTVDGKVNLDEANAFTQRALALLSPTTDTEVVDQLRELAAQGASIDDKVVLEVMNRSEADAVAQLASAQADLASKERELTDLAQRREIERARHMREGESQAEMLRRSDQRRKDLEEEIAKLRAQPAEVRFEPKEVVPEGFASVSDAIAAKTRELEGLSAKRNEVAADVEALAQQQKNLQQAVQAASVGAAQFMAMKEQADKLIAQFPIALLKSLSDESPDVSAAIASLGSTFVLFGQQLNKAAQ